MLISEGYPKKKPSFISDDTSTIRPWVMVCEALRWGVLHAQVLSNSQTLNTSSLQNIFGQIFNRKAVVLRHRRLNSDYRSQDSIFLVWTQGHNTNRYQPTLLHNSASAAPFFCSRSLKHMLRRRLQRRNQLDLRVASRLSRKQRRKKKTFHLIPPITIKFVSIHLRFFSTLK